MPRGDRTGPTGMGPKTGRASGFCSGYDVPGYMNPAFGRGGGFGAGRAGGRGMAYRRGWNQGAGWGRGWRGRPVMPEDVQTENQSADQSTLQALTDRIRQLQSELSAIQESIGRLVSNQLEGEGER